MWDFPKLLIHSWCFLWVKKIFFFCESSLSKIWSRHFRWSAWWSPCICILAANMAFHWWKKFYECQWVEVFSVAAWQKLLIGSARCQARTPQALFFAKMKAWGSPTHMKWAHLLHMEWLQGWETRTPLMGAIRSPSVAERLWNFPSGRSWVGLCMEHSKRAVRRGTLMEVMKICK